MTIGEKMVWAAVFANETKTLSQKPEVAKHQANRAVRFACHRVRMLREAVGEYTYNETGRMAQEMLS